MRARTPSAKVFHLLLIVAFIFNLISPAFAQEVDLKLPKPSQIKPISKPFAPAIIRAVTVNPKDPFLFDFIIDKGDSNLEPQAFEDETQKLVKYFLAALTIPENDLWVNLSPYEQDSMVPRVLGVTELGKDLLIEDYYLKQVTASLTNPNTETGKKFWTLAYAKAQELYGTTKVPINTFSKVWIVPDQAVVLEKDGSAFIADSHLKVYLDQDYVAIKKNLDNKEIGTDKIGSDKAQDINGFSAQIIKEVVLPEIEKEVNAGENFATVRQIYNSAILAAWYKKRLKESLLGRLYADQNKVAGVNAEDMDSGDKIFEKYTAALKTGAYNIIKQDFDLSTQKIVQRKYFSGGVKLVTNNSYIDMSRNNLGNLSPAVTKLMSEFVNTGGAAASSASSNLVVASVSLRASAPSVVAASSQAINRTAPTSGTIAVSIPIALTEKDMSVISGLANMSDKEFDLLFSPADGAWQNRGVFQAARAAMQAQRSDWPIHKRANLPDVQKVLEITRTNPSVAISVSNHAPQVPVAGFVALAQATLKSNGSFDEERFSRYVSNYNGSNGVSPISVTEQQNLQAALIAVQSSLNSTTSGQQAPLTVVAKSIENPTVTAGLGVLTTHTNFAAQMQLNAGDRAANTAVSEYVSVVDTVRSMSPQEFGSIAQSANVSAADIAIIAEEISQLNFARMTPAEVIQKAPTLTYVATTNSDLSYAVFVAAFTKANPSQANASLTENKNWKLFLEMPDAQLQRHFESALKNEGRNATQAQEQALSLVNIFKSPAVRDSKNYSDLSKAIYGANQASPNPVAKTRTDLHVFSLVFAPTATRSSSSLRTVDYIRNLFALNVNEATLRSSVMDSLGKSAKFTDITDSGKVADVLIAVRTEAKDNESFATKIAFAKNVAELKEIVMAEPALVGKEGKEGKLKSDQIEQFNKLDDNDVKRLGGIDLSAERMDLKIKRDGNGVVLPVSDQDLKDLKIDGLSPVILDVQPATPASVPFLMNLANTAAQTK